jgi:hypothetical protein
MKITSVRNVWDNETPARNGKDTNCQDWSYNVSPSNNNNNDPPIGPASLFDFAKSTCEDSVKSNCFCTGSMLSSGTLLSSSYGGYFDLADCSADAWKFNSNDHDSEKSAFYLPPTLGSLFNSPQDSQEDDEDFEHLSNQTSGTSGVIGSHLGQQRSAAQSSVLISSLTEHQSTNIFLPDIMSAPYRNETEVQSETTTMEPEQFEPDDLPVDGDLHESEDLSYPG